jgi:hypothetical protein
VAYLKHQKSALLTNGAKIFLPDILNVNNWLLRKHIWNGHYYLIRMD